DDDFEDVLRRTRRRRSSGKNRRKRRLKIVFVCLLVVMLAVIAGGVGAVAKFRSSCDLTKLKPVENGQNSFVYAADGSLLGSIPAEKNRTRVGLHGVSIWERRATVAIEDHRFYQHGGVDYQGIVRAAWSDLRAGHVVQGGSTIAQQLVRNLCISKERTFKRKIKEACLAIKLSRRWSRNRILSEYMNQVYYGNHAYGIEAAAQTYFSKHARELGLGQAALLAGLPQAPSVYDPFHRPATALDRRDEVLRAMLAYGYITPDQYRTAVAQRDLRLKPGEDGGDPGAHRQPVQPRRAGAPPAGLDVQGVRSDGRDRRGHEPRLDVLHLGALPLPARSVHARVGRPDLRPQLRRLDLGD